MMQLIFRSLMILSLSLLTLPACTKQIRPRPATGPEVIKLDASLDELLQLYQQRQQERSTLKALIEVKADLGERGTHSFQSAWRSQKDRVKMKGFDLFGRTIFDLNLEGSSFSIFIPSEQKVFEGDLEHFDDMAGGKIPFGSSDLLEWLKRSGIPDVGPDRIPALEKRDDIFILYVFSSEAGLGFLKEKIWIERTGFRIERVDLFDRTGIRKGLIILDDYREIDGRFFPFSITGNSRGQVLELKFKEVSFPVAPFAESRAFPGKGLQ